MVTKVNSYFKCFGENRLAYDPNGCGVLFFTSLPCINFLVSLLLYFFVCLLKSWVTLFRSHHA
jgi:hypothetical protein